MSLQVDPNRSPLVISGAWNQAIFTPRYVEQEIMPGPHTVTAEVNLANGTLIPTFKGPLFTLEVRPDRLVWRPSKVSDEVLKAIEVAAERLLGELKLTPIRGIGSNFGLVASADSRSLRELWKFSDLKKLTASNVLIKSTTVRRSLEYDGRNVNLAITQGGAAFEIDINFHRDVANAEAAKNELMASSIRSQLKRAKGLMKAAYGLTL